ncbi:hypothetical protein SUGI_0059460 [Cryptomeria japonica]|nr:hypothetical protein SUGI_0059460 [Cryptomeria japonica]
MTAMDLRFKAQCLEAQNAELRANLEDARKQNEDIRKRNADMMATITAIKDQLSIYESLILYPTYEKLLSDNPESQKEMVELSMKANFFKSSYEIRQNTWAYMVDRWSKRSDNAE